MKAKNFFLLSAFALFTQVSFAQYEERIAHLDAYFKEAFNNYNLPSMSVGIVKSGQVIFQKSYGVLEVGKEEAANEHSIYGIASLSKAFTTASLGMLVDEGKLKWSDRVVDHLPYFELHDKDVSERMTIRDLCSHRSGLATFDGDLLWYGTDYSREEIVKRIRELPLKQEFRTEYGYQNIMYITAGELIEAVSGMSWDQFVQERIFNTLGMDRSYTSFEDIDLSDNMTTPHLEKEPIFHLSYDNSGATAAIHSNVDDLLLWIKMWINSYMGVQSLVSMDAIREIHSQQTVLRVSPYDERNGTHFKGYGLGWFLMDYNGRKVIRHGGGLPGYISQIGLVPEEELGFIILTNDMSYLPSALLYKIVDVFTLESMGDRDWAGEYLKFMENKKLADEMYEDTKLANRAKGTKPSHKLDAYVGNYEDVMYGPSSITMKDGKLHFEMLPSKKIFTADLEHWHYDTFKFKFKDPFLPAGYITFESNSNGKVDGFTIELKNDDFHFYNLHFKRK